ncbi:hypothetical protein KFU94_01255 [Chloroflexi bacterium TSY]|nr:hypothetical protein [Chloroflexi bacterium TSY]
MEERGGEIRLQTTPHKFIVEQERIVGVEAIDGTRIRARHFVASSLNPQQTFLSLLDENLLPYTWRKRARDFQYNLLAPLFALHLNLAEPPHYRAAENERHLRDAFMVILGLEDVAQYLKIVEHHKAGTIPPTIMWGSCPTQFDPTQAPQGKHTAFMWEKLPYHLQAHAENWDGAKEKHGRTMLNLWSQYAPNLHDVVRHVFTRSPLDTERTLPNMREGDLLVGAFTNGQVGYNRPFPGAGHYRGYLPGLYLCGSCCHPGGNVTGLPGYNAAQVILGDLGVTADWMPEPVETQLANLT